MADAIKAEERANATNEPELREANLTVFFLLFITGAIFFSVYFLGWLSVTVAVLFAITAFIGMILFGILAFRIKRFYFRRIYYYISYCLAGICIALSMCAVLIHYSSINLTGIAYSATALCIVAVINLILLSAGKLERILSCLVLILSIAVFILGIALWSKGNLAVGVPLFFAGLSLCAIESAVLIYVFSGDGFFEILAVSYFIFAFIALVIAVLVALQADSCDCDCAPDCSPSSGGRRNKSKRFKN